jgi:diacylglycerol kinase family enzyme
LFVDAMQVGVVAMHIHAVINRSAGSALSLDTAALAKELRKVLQPLGHKVEVELPEPGLLDSTLSRAAECKPDVLLVGGGDGTVRGAASLLIGTGTALSILPLGTVNRLARDLHIPLNPLDAVRSFGLNRFKHIDAAEVNGSVFLCNSLLGLPSLVSEERQKLRGGSLPRRIGGYFHVLKTILASRKRLEVQIDDHISTRRVRVLSLAVSNNLYSHEPTLVLKRVRLDGGELGIYIAKHRSGLGIIWLLVRASLGLWSGDPQFDSFHARKVTINTARTTIRLSNDGEVETFKTPLRYSIRPKALRVFAPHIEGT